MIFLDEITCFHFYFPGRIQNLQIWNQTIIKQRLIGKLKQNIPVAKKKTLSVERVG